MARQPSLPVPEFVGGQNQVVSMNEAGVLQSSAGGLWYVQDASLSTPPAVTSADKGKVWIISGNGTGVWAGHSNPELAVLVKNDGSVAADWLFVDPDATVPAACAAWVDDDKEWWLYDNDDGSFAPLRPRMADASSNTAAEHFTGQYINGRKRYSKTVDFGTLPNNTTKNVAHGISSLELGDAYPIVVSGSFSDGSTVFPLPISTTSGIIAHVAVTSTNLSIVTNFDLSGYSSHPRIEYCKTS